MLGSCCTVDDETALNFAAHFGYLVPLQGTCLVVIIMLLAGSMTIAITTQDYGEWKASDCHAPPFVLNNCLGPPPPRDIGASEKENNIFYAMISILSFGVVLMILWSVYDIPTWNQNHNYLEVMARRVADVKQVDELNLPKLEDLIKSSVGNRDKVKEICGILTKQGCGDTTDLLHYMQSCTCSPHSVV